MYIVSVQTVPTGSVGMTLTLGVNIGHDSAAALVENGEIVAAAEEERFVDVKHYKGLPVKSLEYLFRMRNPDDIDFVGINGLISYAFRDSPRISPMSTERNVPLPTLWKLARRWQNSDLFYVLLRIAAKSMGKNLTGISRLESALSKWKDRIVLVEHHYSHAVSAWSSQPWEADTLVLTVDLAGDGLCATVSVAAKEEITRLASTWRGNSLGRLYTQVTKLLGLKPEEDEYKVMGLAPYGRGEDTSKLLSGLVRLEPGSMVFSAGPLQAEGGKGMHTPFMRKLLAGQRFDNIAAGIQDLLDSLVLEWIRNCVSYTGLRKVSVAGGVFLNVKLNKAIRESGLVDEFFVFPVCGDAGGAAGAAYEAYRLYCKSEGKKPERHHLTDLYKGPEFTEDEVVQSLKASEVYSKATRVNNADEMIAELIVSGKTVGRFSGKMEFGPRALGNRSILARADDHHMIRQLNEKVKQRTWWMPFAPSMLERRTNDYLQFPCESHYMIMSFDTTERRGDLEAAIHPYDYTCRPQTVTPELSPGYFRLLSEYERITGFGGLLNTSFNLHGHTMVMSPEQAVWTFKNSGLDFLFLQNYMLSK